MQDKNVRSSRRAVIAGALAFGVAPMISVSGIASASLSVACSGPLTDCWYIV